jgi:signal transduction histidine kinase
MMSVGGLAAGMAHEINNPLAGVLQNANVLANRLGRENLPANLKAAQLAGTSMDAISQFMENRGIFKMLDAISKSGVRIASMVENMLSFARKSESSFSDHDPVILVDSVLDLAATDYDLKNHYDFKSILIQKEYESDLPMISCESSKIQQVLLNILNNGAYAMFKQPALVPPQFIIRLAYESDLNMLRVEIQDNGPGMDKTTAARIFDPFFTTKPVGVGTGLGLSVSYFIITENHQGTMNVVSSPNKGANFIIGLPLERERHREPV